MSLSFKLRGAALAAVALVAMAGCASTSEETAAPTTSPTSPTSTAEALPTLTEGKLTIATGDPAYSPWVLNNDPASGEGFEAAVAYAVAEQLGYDKDDVVWVRTTFDAAIAPGPKDFDFNLQQFSITDERKQAVDFSSPYYTTSQAIVTTGSSPAATATSLADLKAVKVGAMTGTTSYEAAAAQIGTDKLDVFNSNDDAVAALQAGQVDAIVVDLPTAFYLRDAVLDGGKIVGQLADSSAGGDEFGLLLAKDSPLTSAVTAAVDALREDGTLATLEDKWLTTAESVPVLK